MGLPGLSPDEIISGDRSDARSPKLPAEFQLFRTGISRPRTPDNSQVIRQPLKQKHASSWPSAGPPSIPSVTRCKFLSFTQYYF